MYCIQHYYNTVAYIGANYFVPYPWRYLHAQSEVAGNKSTGDEVATAATAASERRRSGGAWGNNCGGWWVADAHGDGRGRSSQRRGRELWRQERAAVARARSLAGTRWPRLRQELAAAGRRGQQQWQRAAAETGVCGDGDRQTAGARRGSRQAPGRRPEANKKRARRTCWRNRVHMPKKKLAEATAGRLEDFSNVDLGSAGPNDFRW
jgi:hypothetical protein